MNEIEKYIIDLLTSNTIDADDAQWQVNAKYADNLLQNKPIEQMKNHQLEVCIAYSAFRMLTDEFVDGVKALEWEKMQESFWLCVLTLATRKLKA